MRLNPKTFKSFRWFMTFKFYGRILDFVWGFLRFDFQTCVIIKLKINSEGFKFELKSEVEERSEEKTSLGLNKEIFF